MDSFFSQLKQQVSFHQTNSDSEEDNCVANTSQQDTEVDGYLLIDIVETQTTEHDVLSSSKEYPDAPPTYRQVSESDELPSYLSVLSGSYPIISGPAMFSKVELSPLKPQESIPPLSQRSAVSDVPFRLHSLLEMQLQADTILNGLDLKPNSFDWSKHSHDFQREKLCLRDMNSDEMASIDDFLIPPSSPELCNKLSSRDSEVNLMKF